MVVEQEFRDDSTGDTPPTLHNVRKYVFPASSLKTFRGKSFANTSAASGKALSFPAFLLSCVKRFLAAGVRGNETIDVIKKLSEYNNNYRPEEVAGSL